jgi:hypothetical protein
MTDTTERKLPCPLCGSTHFTMSYLEGAPHCNRCLASIVVTAGVNKPASRARALMLAALYRVLKRKFSERKDALSLSACLLEVAHTACLGYSSSDIYRRFSGFMKLGVAADDALHFVTGLATRKSLTINTSGSQL